MKELLLYNVKRSYKKSLSVMLIVFAIYLGLSNRFWPYVPDEMQEFIQYFTIVFGMIVFLGIRIDAMSGDINEGRKNYIFLLPRSTGEIINGHLVVMMIENFVAISLLLMYVSGIRYLSFDGVIVYWLVSMLLSISLVALHFIGMKIFRDTGRTIVMIVGVFVIVFAAMVFFGNSEWVNHQIFDYIIIYGGVIVSVAGYYLISRFSAGGSGQYKNYELNTLFLLMLFTYIAYGFMSYIMIKPIGIGYVLIVLYYMICRFAPKRYHFNHSYKWITVSLFILHTVYFVRTYPYYILGWINYIF